MSKLTFQELLDAGVHFGHMKRKWNPKMAPYIFMEKNGIHIIDLYKTIIKLDEASKVVSNIARSGRKILFVATKKQAKEIVAEKVQAIGMPYVAERWPGGMLTNFPTIRKAVKKMKSIYEMIEKARSTPCRNVKNCRFRVKEPNWKKTSAQLSISFVCLQPFL